MSQIVNYQFDNDISHITMDDGKANAMSVKMLAGLNDALDKAEKAGGVVILSGRPPRLSPQGGNARNEIQHRLPRKIP